MNTPRFLLINFNGSVKKSQKLEKEIEIDIGEFTLTNIGPKQYGLYAFICEDKSKNYVAYIKNENIWKKYSEDNKVEKYDINLLNKYCPNMVIYQGIRDRNKCI